MKKYPQFTNLLLLITAELSTVRQLCMSFNALSTRYQQNYQRIFEPEIPLVSNAGYVELVTQWNEKDSFLRAICSMTDMVLEDSKLLCNDLRILPYFIEVRKCVDRIQLLARNIQPYPSKSETAKGLYHIVHSAYTDIGEQSNEMSECLRELGKHLCIVRETARESRTVSKYQPAQPQIFDS